MMIGFQGSLSGRTSGFPIRRGRLTVPAASSGAVLARPSSDAGVTRRVPVSPRDDSVELIPASSGLDFIDLVGMDESIVINRLQDAVTFRVLVGHSPPKEPVRAPPSPTFNLKQLKLYRDNVTRNLAPTVARGFADAARAAGHYMPATQSSSPPEPTQPAQPFAQSTSTPSVAPPPQQQQQQQVWAAAPTSNASVTGITTGASSGDAGFGAPCSPSVTALRPTTSVAAIAAPAPTTAAGACYSPVHCVSQMPAAGHGTAVSFVVQQGAGTGAACPPQGLRMAGRVHATAGNAWEFDDSSPSAVDRVIFDGATASASGRRRGSRGAGCGRYLSGAGRQAGGVGPAWI